MTENNLTENLTAALVMTGNNFSLILTEDFDSCAGSPISLTTVQICFLLKSAT